MEPVVHVYGHWNGLGYGYDHDQESATVSIHVKAVELVVSHVEWWNLAFVSFSVITNIAIAIEHHRAVELAPWGSPSSPI